MKESSISKYIGTCASRLVLVSLFLLASQIAYADPFTFSTIPASGLVPGQPGSTVGWGYSITNLSSTNWLMITSLDAGSFFMGTPDASIFNFPILEPGATVTVSYVAGLQGLFQFTWDLNAVEFENIGTFILGGEFWNGDPFAGGEFVESAADQSAPYIARVFSPNTVSEPSTLTLLALALGCVLLGRGHWGRPRPSEQTIL